MRWLAGVLLAVWSLPAGAQPAAALRIDASTVGRPLSNAPAELFLPRGDGPFAAMVVLHGCDGIGRHYRIWARQLVAWGYVALLVDSFRPRGVTTVCNHGREVPPELRARDAFAAADYLRGRADVLSDRIGVIGFSHGASSALMTATTGRLARDDARPFAVVVAFYPGCGPAASALATDTMILIGDADDWTPAQRCIDASRTLPPSDHQLTVKVYPGALHGFDSPLPPHEYAGHHVGRQPAAAADALALTRTFLAQHLSP